MQEINDLQIVREALDIIKPLAQKLEPEKYAKIESDIRNTMENLLLTDSR